jgi:hypothetical protein
VHSKSRRALIFSSDQTLQLRYENGRGCAKQPASHVGCKAGPGIFS